MAEFSGYPDATSVAAQLGRLDFVSSVLAAIGVALVLGGIFAFVNFRGIARSQAQAEARKVAEEVAERTANEYLQRELLSVVGEYRTMMESEGPADADPDSLASVQDDAEKQ